MRILLGIFFAISFIWLAASLLAFSPDVFFPKTDLKSALDCKITRSVWKYYGNNFKNMPRVSWLLDLDTVRQPYLDTLQKIAGCNLVMPADTLGMCGYLIMMEFEMGQHPLKREFPVILIDNHFNVRHIFDSATVRPKHWFTYRAGCK